jgi:hypothetical protein
VKKLGYTLALDVITVVVFVFLILGFTAVAQSQTLGLTGGKPLSTLQADLVKDPVVAQEFLTNIKALAYTLSFGVIFLLALLVLTIAASRSLLWNYLQNRKFKLKKVFRWAGLLLFLVLLAIPYILVYLLLQVLLSMPFTNVVTAKIISQTLIFVFLVTYIWFAWLVQYFFVKGTVWSALEKAFASIKKVYLTLVYTILAGIGLSVLFFLFQVKFYGTVPSIISSLLFLGYLAYFRIYTVERL